MGINQSRNAYDRLLIGYSFIAQVAAQCGIQAMPTFHVYKNGQKFGELTGASKDRLQALVESAKK